MTAAELKNIAEKKGYGRQKKHVFFCAGEKCADAEKNAHLWKYLKKSLENHKDAGVLRTKAQCLRICVKGPIMLVYPEGVFYYDLNEHKIDEIVQKHLLGGAPVSEYAFMQYPLK